LIESHTGIIWMDGRFALSTRQFREAESEGRNWPGWHRSRRCGHSGWAKARATPSPHILTGYIFKSSARSSG